MTLYEMTDAARNLKALLEADEIDEQTFTDTLEAIGADDKVDSYCKIIRQIEAEMIARKMEVERLKAMNDRAEKAIERMKAALDNFMSASGQTKVQTTLFSVSYRTSKAVAITDGTKIPERFLTVKTVTTPNKTEIKKYISDGGTVDGAEIVESRNIQIK